MPDQTSDVAKYGAQRGTKRNSIVRVCLRLDPTRCRKVCCNLHWVVTLVIGLGLATASRAAPIANGGFETGDLTSWDTAAVDDNESAVSPAPVSVVTHPAGNVAEIQTVPYSDPPGFSFPQTWLSQTFTLTGVLLGFDYAFQTTVDSGEPDEMFLRDALQVTLDDGVSAFTLLVADPSAVVFDPDGNFPGTISGSPSDHPLLTDRIHLQIDLGSLASPDVTLRFEVLNDLDGHTTVARVGRVVIPEPSTATLAVGLMGLTALGVGLQRRCMTHVTHNACGRCDTYEM